MNKEIEKIDRQVLNIEVRKTRIIDEKFNVVFNEILDKLDELIEVVNDLDKKYRYPLLKVDGNVVNSLIKDESGTKASDYRITGEH